MKALINPRTFSSAKGERHEAHFPVPRRSPAYLAGCLSAKRRSGWGGAFAGFSLCCWQQHEWWALETGGIARGAEGGFGEGVIL
jgi:hypothetical protein